MDAAVKNRARNLAETQQRALDGVDFAIKKCAGSKSIRKAVVNALQVDCTDAQIGRWVRLAALSKVEPG